MHHPYTFTSLTRTSPLEVEPVDIGNVPREEWKSGDFVACQIVDDLFIHYQAELANGRMVTLAKGDVLIGALGIRFATLEATGSWEQVGEDGRMHLLTGAGLFGLLTSKSMYLRSLVNLQYQGHMMLQGNPCNMKDFVLPATHSEYNIPTIMIFGTSMSAGKTMAARIIVRLLKRANLTVLGAKLTGAGRYRDILSMQDSGADYIFDFVEAGLPSTVVSQEEYAAALGNLLGRMQDTAADVAVVEIGASPLEPYNGLTAYETLQDSIRCSVLCASDPYAVYGVMQAFGVKPDVVSGIATNTLAGIQLIERLCDVRAINVIDPARQTELCEIVGGKLGIDLLVGS